MASPITNLQRWLLIGAPDKPKVYQQVSDTADLKSLHYWLEIFFSAGIATLGLVLNSPAVVIGAMLISPLMGPLMAAGLGLAIGDVYLALRAIANLLLSIALAVGLSALLVWLLPFHAATDQILSRTTPTLLDLAIALLSGLAGSVAMARSGNKDGLATLPGVAIAVALMPPLCVMGFGLGDGANTRIMGGAGLLFLTNLVAIVASAFVVFLLIGMNDPAMLRALDESRQNEALKHRLLRSKLGSLLSHIGHLHWRVVLLVVLLAILFVPLRSALQQVAGETLARNSLQHAIDTLVPKGALVAQQVEVGKKIVAVRLVVTKAIPEAKVQAAEREIEQRTHWQAQISVASVASQSELARLTQQIQNAAAVQPVAPPPPPKPLEDINAEMIARVQPVLTETWPAAAPLQKFVVSLHPGGFGLTVWYTANASLPSIAVGILQSELAKKLSVPTLQLDAIRVRKPATRRTSRHTPHR
jgi:uncharacterized hydrophobic protein (TIGR00271 family)